MKTFRLFGSYDGKKFFEMMPGVKKRKGHSFYASFDNGDTFYPLRFTNDYSEMLIAGNAVLGEIVKWTNVAPTA